MLQAVPPAHELFLAALGTGAGKGIPGAGPLLPDLFQCEFDKLQGARMVAFPTLVMDRELLASEYAILWVDQQFVPQCRGAFEIAALPGHLREFAGGLRAEFLGQA